MKKINVGIIGSGFMGAAHAEALRRIGGINILAISSADGSSMKSLAEKFDIVKTFADWKDLISDSEIDVVHNCTPNHLHYEINKAVISAGKHIISEKPLTVTSRQSEELLNLLKKNNVVNAINFNYRFYPLARQAREMVANGELGDIYFVHGHYLQDWLYYPTDYNWRLETELSGDSRAIADIGSHWCDMIQFVTGQKITKVLAHISTVHKKRIKPSETLETFKGKEQKQIKGDEINISTEDAGAALFELESGARGSFTVSQVSAGRKNRFWFEVDGSKKAVAWDQEKPNELWIGHREKPNEIIIKDPALLSDEAKKLAHYPGGHPEGYPDGPKNLFASVYEFIRNGKDPNKDKTDFPVFKDGHIENLIVEALLKSAKEEKWIEIKN